MPTGLRAAGRPCDKKYKKNAKIQFLRVIGNFIQHKFFPYFHHLHPKRVGVTFKKFIFIFNG
jgi:hypothetical protein